MTDRLNLSYQKIIKISQFSSVGYYLMPDMNGSCPIVSKRFSITPINFKNTDENFFVDSSMNFLNDKSANGADSTQYCSERNTQQDDELDNKQTKQTSKSGTDYVEPTDPSFFDNLVPSLNGVINSRQSQRRKISPFEIFDDAVYSSSAYSLMINNDGNNDGNNNCGNDDDFNTLTSINTMVTIDNPSNENGEEKPVKSKSVAAGDKNATKNSMMSRSFSIRNSKSKSFTNLNRSSITSTTNINTNGTNVKDNGSGRLFGFAMKLFKKSKSSSNIVNDSQGLGLSFHNHGEEFPKLPDNIDLRSFETGAEKSLDPLKEKNISASTDKSTSVYAALGDSIIDNTDASRGYLLGRKEKSDTSLVTRRKTFDGKKYNNKIINDGSKSATDFKKLNDQANKTKSLIPISKPLSASAPRTPKSIVSRSSSKDENHSIKSKDADSFFDDDDYDDEDEDDDDDDISSFASSKRKLRNKASMRSLKNLTNGTKFGSAKRNATSTSLKSMSSSMMNSAAANGSGGKAKSDGLESLPLPQNFRIGFQKSCVKSSSFH